MSLPEGSRSGKAPSENEPRVVWSQEIWPKKRTRVCWKWGIAMAYVKSCGLDEDHRFDHGSEVCDSFRCRKCEDGEWKITVDPGRERDFMDWL